MDFTVNGTTDKIQETNTRASRALCKNKRIQFRALVPGKRASSSPFRHTGVGVGGGNVDASRKVIKHTRQFASAVEAHHSRQPSLPIAMTFTGYLQGILKTWYLISITVANIHF